MRPERFSPLLPQPSFIRALRAAAPARDLDGGFPTEGFAVLRSNGLIGSPPLRDAEIGTLLRILAEIGRGDLPVGRIYEGHVNALALIRRNGTSAQLQRFDTLAANGGIFGIWNTDKPEDPLRMEGGRLVGQRILPRV